MAVSRIGGVALDRKVGDAEQRLRVELAAAFRVAHHLGWNVDTLNHISLRIRGTDTFLMNPQGLGWDEITASSLSTLDYKWNVLSHSGLKIQPAGYNFHSGILKARPDVHCVMHATKGRALSSAQSRSRW
jgi:ribulose-5-phosphate 4-epimerase/fuculose-1-phosphate aldolase